MAGLLPPFWTHNGPSCGRADAEGLLIEGLLPPSHGGGTGSNPVWASSSKPRNWGFSLHRRCNRMGLQLDDGSVSEHGLAEARGDPVRSQTGA